jgi:hypothetical protein
MGEPSPSLRLGRRQFIIGASAAAGGLLWRGREAAAASIPQPTLSPLADPATKGFHVWNVEPIDYVVEEFLMSGTSPIWEPTSVLDEAGGESPSAAAFNYLQHTPNHAPRKVLGSGPYTTRVILYRPRDMTKFSGVTIIEPIHSEYDGYDFVFNTISRFYGDRGIAVAMLQNPASFAVTAKADPQRYGALAMQDWTQFWGTVMQLGTLLKSDATPLHAVTRRLYMTGYSLTGMMTSTFANFYHDGVRHADGRPIFDGYLPHGNEYYIHPLDVPVIRVNSQGDFNYFTSIAYNPFARVPDSNDPWNRTRRYEVAGAQHGTLPPPEDGAAIPPFWNAEMNSPCWSKFPQGAKFNDMIFLRPVWEIAVVHMEEWITENVPPPRAPWISIGKDTKHAEFDENGNAAGGLRMPDLQVPVATYGTGENECRLRGYMIPFSTEKLRALYSNKANYLRLYDAATEAMVAQRWILPDSAERLKKHARNVEAF